jgi:hypothetical protein
VLSIALVRTKEPSGDRAIPVTVSVCPGMVYSTDVDFRVSQTLTRLSMPALIWSGTRSRLIRLGQTRFQNVATSNFWIWNQIKNRIRLAGDTHKNF